MEPIVYIGCRTTKERNARGRGIRVMKAAPGKWEQIQLVEGQINPSFHGDFSEISAFSVAEDGTLTYLNTSPPAVSTRCTCPWIRPTAGYSWRISRPAR